MPSTTIALLSGGLDSATAAALALERGDRVIGLSFDYGQRHRRELAAAAALASSLGLAEHHQVAVNLAAWGGSSLTDASQPLPSDGVQAGVIPSTYVPGRNTVFIAIGLSLAEARAAEQLVLGVNAVDYSGYPDCRPDYLATFQTLADLASRAGREGRGARLWAPLIQLSKVDIVREALRLGVPIDRTWSCYSGGEHPCGVCDSCRIRDAALRQAGRPDLASQPGQPGSVSLNSASPCAVPSATGSPSTVSPGAVSSNAALPSPHASSTAALDPSDTRQPSTPHADLSRARAADAALQDRGTDRLPGSSLNGVSAREAIGSDAAPGADARGAVAQQPLSADG